MVSSEQGKAARHANDGVTDVRRLWIEGKGDGIFINTAGVGIIEHAQRLAPDQVHQSR